MQTLKPLFHQSHTANRFTLVLAAVLCFGATAKAQLSVVNGNFSDVTGMTDQSDPPDGWKKGLPPGWSSIGLIEAYNVYTGYGAGGLAYLATLGNLYQTVGTLTSASDVVLTFDNSALFGGGTNHAMIMDAAWSILAEGDFGTGVAWTLQATNVPSGTSIVIRFYSAGTPGLDNVSVSAFATGPGPLITQEPASLTLLSPGQTLNLSVVAVGTPTPSYQWRTNGVALSGETNPTLTINNVTPANSANYTVVVTNPGGSVTSTVAQVIVKIPTTIISDPLNGTAGTLLNSTPPTSRGGVGSQPWGAGTHLVMNGIRLTETNASDSAFVPFSPDAGNVYTLSCQMNLLTGNWIALGFSQNSHPDNYSGIYTSTNNMQAWMCQVMDNGGTYANNYFLFLGPETANALPSPSLAVGFDVVHTNAIALNTVGTNWTVQYFVDGNAVGGPAPYSATPGVNPVIGYVGIGNSDTNYAPGGQSATFEKFTLQSVLPRIIPALSIHVVGGKATVSWPEAAGGWQLESSSSLSAPSWTPVPEPVAVPLTVVNGNFSDFTGMTNWGDGWYGGVPIGWTSAGSPDHYSVYGVYGSPYLASFGTLRQNLGTLTHDANVTVTFDVPGNYTGTNLIARITDGVSTLASVVNTSIGTNKKLTANNVAQGTTVYVEFSVDVDPTADFDNVAVKTVTIRNSITLPVGSSDLFFRLRSTY